MALNTREESDVIVRPLQAADLPAADRIVRVAFGTAAGVPHPETFFGDMDTVQNRWKSKNTAAFGAEMNGDIVGANVVTRWGSFGFFGPFGIRPDLWNRGIAKKIMTAVMSCLTEWDVRLAGLYTVPGSPKHIEMYQQFGFKPRCLTAVMRKVLSPAPGLENNPDVVRFSELSKSEQSECLGECRRLTDTVYEGLDLTGEIETILESRIGDTLLIRDHSKLTGFAACHLGSGTEAGGNACYVKFAAARTEASDSSAFENVLAACETYARRHGVSNLVAGVNTARQEAYDMMMRHGFRIDLLGVAMLKPDTAGFNRPGVFVIDDWR